jgi:hypothetical protein
MKVLTAKVVDGKIEVGDDLANGSTVAIISLDPEGVRLTPEEEQELAESFAEIRAGNYVDAAELLADLRARSRA